MITPNEQYNELGNVLGTANLYFKREDLHPLGSHKGRSIPHMIDEHIKTGSVRFAISSSGNAALAAALYVREVNEKRSEKATWAKDGKSAEPIILEIFVGQNIASKKLAKLETLKSDTVRVSIHDRPKQALMMKTRDSDIVSLRQSEDDTALAGYDSLCRELAEIPDLQAIFIGTSSGTTAQALAQYFLKNTGPKKTVEIHIIQTPTCHPMVDAMLAEKGTSAENESDEKSIADAIVDRTALRKNTLIPLLEKTGGAAWIADNESLSAAMDIVKKHTGLSISANSALSVSGLMQAVYTGRRWKGSVACLVCGD